MGGLFPRGAAREETGLSRGVLLSLPHPLISPPLCLAASVLGPWVALSLPTRAWIPGKQKDKKKPPPSPAR